MAQDTSASKIPQVDKVLRHPRVAEQSERIGRDFLAEIVRQELQSLREALKSGQSPPDLDIIAERIAIRTTQILTPQLRKVINGTGVVLNTNLGRAPLPPELFEPLRLLAAGYCNLEIDLESGKRGKRAGRVSSLLRLLTGAEAAIVVNNNAAAVVLAVNCFARDKEVIVSRGELIEIGGSFRLPDVIESAGGRLREVGTTNRTRVADFANAINANTGLLVRCHRSNFEVRGFVEQVSLDELVKLSAQTNVPLLEDLGSGMLFNFAAAGVSKEPTVSDVIKTGCDIVSFSGDKLLGGPQAGILAGKRESIEKLAKHPLYRALRPDKITLALLEHILISYLHPQPEEQIPVLSMMCARASDIRLRATKFVEKISERMRNLELEVVETSATAGGGSLPGDSVDSFGISLSSFLSAHQLSELMRKQEPPVIAIVQNDKVILDFRTISEPDEEFLVSALVSLDKNTGIFSDD